MNKKAQTSEGILPIIALVLVGLAVFSFLSFNGKIETQSQEISGLIYETNINQKIINAEIKSIVEKSITECNECTETQITQTIKSKANKKQEYFSRETNLFARFRNNDFKFFQNQNNFYEIQMENIFVKSQIGELKQTRNFNACLTFDITGNFISFCEIEDS